jgi:hypothetical protein
MSTIRSLWDGQRTLRKPYSTSSLYEYHANKRVDGEPVCKFPAPHFESPASGNESRHGDLAVRRATPGSCHLDVFMNRGPRFALSRELKADAGRQVGKIIARPEGTVTT